MRYLWTLVLKDWILNCFGNAHAGEVFHFFAVRVKISFWNFDVRTVLKVTAQPWVVFQALYLVQVFTRRHFALRRPLRNNDRNYIYKNREVR